MSSGLVIIGKSLHPGLGCFMKPRNFHFATVTSWVKTQSIIDFAPKTTFQTILNSSGSLALFKDMAPYQPLDDAKSQGTFWNSPERWFRRKLRCVRVSIALQWESCTMHHVRVQFLSCMPWLQTFFSGKMLMSCNTSCDWESVINLTLVSNHPQLLSRMVFSSVK